MIGGSIRSRTGHLIHWPLADVAHQHHERLDGSDYPQGLNGD
ncbi:MAG: hypothetical protein O3A88_06335 [Proteobacteria bacterium]|nr:hypothetical protein [Pseudomonadota bacterium]